MASKRVISREELLVYYGHFRDFLRCEQAHTRSQGNYTLVFNAILLAALFGGEMENTGKVLFFCLLGMLLTLFSFGSWLAAYQAARECTRRWKSFLFNTSVQDGASAPTVLQLDFLDLPPWESGSSTSKLGYFNSGASIVVMLLAWIVLLASALLVR